MERTVGVALIMEELVRSAYRDRQSKDVQPLQWSILRYLSTSSVTGVPLTSIAAYCGVTAAPVSRAIKTLEKRGFVQKDEKQEDRRSLSVRITSQGLEALEDDPILRIAYKLNQLTEEEMRVVARCLRRIILLNEVSEPIDG